MNSGLFQHSAHTLPVMQHLEFPSGDLSEVAAIKHLFHRSCCAKYLRFHGSQNQLLQLSLGVVSLHGG